MKWAIVVLIALGLVAAICAAALVFFLRADSTGKETPTEIIVAAKSLPAMSVITSACISQDKVAKEKLPEGYLSAPVQAIGKVLSMPVVEGQVLTQSCFIAEGTGPHLAAALPYGMRAFGITLASYSITGGLLYPGCLVDVLVTFKLPSNDRDSGQAISTSLLTGVEVLAVESATVASKSKRDADAPGVRTEGRRLAVTLMVDPRQAEALQLAMENGSISLSVRNPLDKKPVDTDVTVLNQSRLAALGLTMGPTVSRWEGYNTAAETAFAEGSDSPQTAFETASGDLQRGLSQQWNVTVIRGQEVTNQSVKIQAGETVQ